MNLFKESATLQKYIEEHNMNTGFHILPSEQGNLPTQIGKIKNKQKSKKSLHYTKIIEINILLLNNNTVEMSSW